MTRPTEGPAAEGGRQGCPEPRSRGVRIVTDSNADVPPEIADRLGIAVVPNYVYFGSDLIRDGRDMAPHAFFERMARDPTPPRTTHPPVGEFLEVFERSLDGDGYESIVSILVASTVSGTVNSAHAAAEMLPDPSRVEIVDSGQLSMGIGWVAIRAAEAARRGATRAEVTQVVRDLTSRVRVVAMIESLDNLVRGGRISHLVGVLGGLLQIKPVLCIQAGQVKVVGRVRTRARAMGRVLEEVEGWGPVADLAVMHAGAEPLATELAERLRAMGMTQPILVAPAGAALSVHLGLGTVGVCALLGSPG